MSKINIDCLESKQARSLIAATISSVPGWEGRVATHPESICYDKSFLVIFKSEQCQEMFFQTESLSSGKAGKEIEEC